MIFRAPAKINLGLHLKHKREDGFHELESIFHAIPLFDYIEVIPSFEDSFFSYNLKIPGDASNNLCLKALNLLRSLGYEVPFFEVHLLKNIPIGAGLGGGSSDAVAVLKGINQIQKLGIDNDTLLTYAAELGSDCPFFLLESAARVTGRGEELTPLNFSLTGSYLKLIYPKLHISTEQAYSSLDLKKTTKSEIILPRSKSDWKKCFKNDFESSLWPRYPQLKEIKENLINSGAYYASLSGSGSSVFGLFEAKPFNQLYDGLYDEWVLEL